MITIERELVEAIRAGMVHVPSEYERDSLRRAEQIARGNFEILRAFERHVEREIARESR